MLLSAQGKRCLNCQAWMPSGNDVLTPFVVARALNILMNHGFGGHWKTEELVSRSRHDIPQHRIDLFLPNPEPSTSSNLLCEVSWFYPPEPPQYRYLNKINRTKRRSSLVPEIVQLASAELSRARTNPGSLRFTDANLDQSRDLNWLRMEQSYGFVQDLVTEHQNLIVRVEFAWSKTPFATFSQMLKN